MTSGISKPYILDDPNEPQRLERQADLEDLSRFFAYLPLATDARVLDAGCGSGVMTRLLAQRAPTGWATGVDTNARHIASAAQHAAAAGITNITFQEANIFALLFADQTFDLVWCKYVLQWVEQPVQAITEFCRVTRPGGYVVCAHFDGFGVLHDPVDAGLQADANAFFPSVIDPFISRKQYHIFVQAGLADVTLHIEADPLYTVAGAIDAGRRANWQAQFDAAFPAIIRCLGSGERATRFVERFVAYQDRADTASYCILYTVTGRVSR
jgi:SAM-dependent methyltransferase